MLIILEPPQGSDVLIKPYKSKIYKYFSIKALRKGAYITVDSVKMQKHVKILSGVNAVVIQNGIDIKTINKNHLKKNNVDREKIVSIRGFTSLYRIKQIIEARNNSRSNQRLGMHLIFPFKDANYYESTIGFLKKQDRILGRLDKNDMYKLLFESFLVISIPTSDSSPRSVYEAIFCGCAVAITREEYYESLPQCMRDRIIVVDISKQNWFDEAIKMAKNLLKFPYVPSKEVLRDYNQENSFNHIAQLLEWVPKWV